MSLLRESARGRVKLAEMSMTPLIDCVFLLLLFFMVGMKFREIDRQLEARLPHSGVPDPKKPPPVIPELWVAIQNGGTAANPAPRILIGGKVMSGWAGVRAFLRDYARIPTGRDDRVILLPADDAAHGWVMKVLDILKELGYENVGFRR